MLTLQGDAVHGEGSGQLGGHLHAAADQRLPKHVLEGLVKGRAVAKLTDHRDGILTDEEKREKKRDREGWRELENER